MKKSAISGMFLFFVIFIVALIFLVVATLVIKQGSSNQISNFENIQCRKSNQDLANMILTPDETGTTGVSFVSQQINENCPTKYTKLSSDSKKDEINKELAEGLANCWYSYLEGKEAIFPQDTKKSLCAICKIIDFSDVPEESKEDLNFGSYLSKHKPTIDKTRTYSEYLELNKEGISTYNNLKISDKMAVVYYSEQDVETLKDRIIKIGAVGTGAGTGIVTTIIIFSGPIGWAVAGTAISLAGVATMFLSDTFDKIIEDFKFQTGFLLIDYNDKKQLSLFCDQIISTNLKEPLLQTELINE